PGDFTAANPNRAWSTSIDARTIGERLGRSAGRRVGVARRFVGTSRDAAGRILETTVVGSDGRARVSGSTLESALGLRSTNVWIGSDRRVRDPVRARYDSLRCRPGLPTSTQGVVPGGVRQTFEH